MILSLATSNPSSAIILNGFVFVPWCLEFTNQTVCEISSTCKDSQRALNEITMPCKNDCFWDNRIELHKGNTLQVNLKRVIWHSSRCKLNNFKKACLVTKKKKLVELGLLRLLLHLPTLITIFFYKYPSFPHSFLHSFLHSSLPFFLSFFPRQEFPMQMLAPKSMWQPL